MGESFVASVQYGDMKGTIAIDGFEAGGPLGDLAERVKIKPGFMPVGFGLTRLHPLENGKIPLVIFAVDASEVGVSADEMNAYAAANGQLPVTGFHGEIAPAEFEGIFKRFSLRAQSRGLKLTPDQLTIKEWHYHEADGDGDDDDESE